ncbi:hypothetical protein LXL04_037360 [Taraxacum kok-saghyz]
MAVAIPSAIMACMATGSNIGGPPPPPGSDLLLSEIERSRVVILNESVEIEFLPAQGIALSFLCSLNYLGFNKPSDHGQFCDGETQTRASHRISHDPKGYAALGVSNRDFAIAFSSDTNLSHPQTRSLAETFGGCVTSYKYHNTRRHSSNIAFIIEYKQRAELCGFVVHNEELDFMGPSFINSNEELNIVGSSFISFHLRYGENSNINALFSALSRCGILLTVVCPDTLMTVVRHDALMTVVRHDTLRTVPSDHVQFRDGETQTRASHRTVHDPKVYLAPGIGSCSNNSIVISKPKMTLHDYQVKNGQGEDQIGEQGPFGIFSRLCFLAPKSDLYKVNHVTTVKLSLQKSN